MEALSSSIVPSRIVEPSLHGRHSALSDRLKVPAFRLVSCKSVEKFKPLILSRCERGFRALGKEVSGDGEMEEGPVTSEAGITPDEGLSLFEVLHFRLVSCYWNWKGKKK